jgi:hypothetical protein
LNGLESGDYKKNNLEELNRCAVDFKNFLFLVQVNSLSLYCIGIFSLLLVESNLHTISFAIPSA